MLIRKRVVCHAITLRPESHNIVRMELFRLPTRGLRRQPNLLHRSSAPAGVRRRTSRHLGRESQFFVSFYFFGSMINEANEPSSACRPWRIYHVETSTPPTWICTERAETNYRPLLPFGQGLPRASKVLLPALCAGVDRLVPAADALLDEAPGRTSYLCNFRFERLHCGRQGLHPRARRLARETRSAAGRMDATRPRNYSTARCARGTCEPLRRFSRLRTGVCRS